MPTQVPATLAQVPTTLAPVAQVPGALTPVPALTPAAHVPAALAQVPVTLAPVIPKCKLIEDIPIRIFGYAVTHDWLVKYAQHHYCTQLQAPRLSQTARAHIMARAKFAEFHLVKSPDDPVMSQICFGIADNTTCRRVQESVNAEKIAKLKAIMGMSEPPTWHDLYDDDDSDLPAEEFYDPY
jgi:hypothetical protein